MITIFFKAICIWLLLMVVAIVNGVLREQVLNQVFGSVLALPISGILLVVFIFTVSYLFIPWIGNNSLRVFCLIGMVWLIFTLAFEFSFGYFVLGKSLSEISVVFNILEGNLFIVALLTTLLSPCLVARIRRVNW